MATKRKNSTAIESIDWNGTEPARTNLSRRRSSETKQISVEKGINYSLHFANFLIAALALFFSYKALSLPDNEDLFVSVESGEMTNTAQNVKLEIGDFRSGEKSVIVPLRWELHIANRGPIPITIVSYEIVRKNKEGVSHAFKQYLFKEEASTPVSLPLTIPTDDGPGTLFVETPLNLPYEPAQLISKLDEFRGTFELQKLVNFLAGAYQIDIFGNEVNVSPTGVRRVHYSTDMPKPDVFTIRLTTARGRTFEREFSWYDSPPYMTQ